MKINKYIQNEDGEIFNFNEIPEEDLVKYKNILGQKLTEGYLKLTKN